jgi:hypothetical protein
MTTRFGAPKTGWAKLVPELLVSDIGTSIEFWCNQLGFAIAYQRPEEKFICLERPEGAQIMLSQRSGKWETGLLDRPYGRGTMFQVYVTSIEPVQRSLEAAGWPLYAGPLRSGVRLVTASLDSAKSSCWIRTGTLSW